MKRQDVNYVRFTASDGKSLQWKEKMWDYNQNKEVEEVMYAQKTTIIDINQLIGEVKEIPYEVYQEWYDNNSFNLGYAHY